ncbi:Major facilitator superfamily domain, general substrate transporter [Metarhizium rileyi]|uniref:Major facilitator superfamily domain, general substrate transporter n=1 Tax=Metarhizium rileyi (strain RCEF 4871) TaxID=1649241 RepID=A0A166YG93_METRR|nr:Major facilitator superfamily domain, general substrate transporter [Metarhizium rileyi RCEF 4871]TWU77400.1 hypothetical protein ED733_006282 [Metarhizium rileyi]
MSDSSDTEKTEQTVAGSSSPPGLVPEEGIRGWICVAGAFLCLFCSFGFLSASGVFQTTYQETTLRLYSPSDISWIFAIQLAFMWAPGPLWGRIIDAYGPAPVLCPCSVLCVFALCMLSLADKYYQIFLAQGITFAIGSGGIFTAAFTCVGQWFVRRRGLATGLASTGSSLGGVIFPIFLNRLNERFGLQAAIRYTALLIGIMMAASCFTVCARLPRKKWNPDLKWLDVTLFKQLEFTLYTAGSFFVMWGVWGPFNFISSMALNAGFESTLALYLISIINAASIPGRILPPYLGDRVGHFNVITICSLLTGGSIMALWLPFNYHPSQTGIIIFAVFYGFVSGTFVSLLIPCAAKAGNLETLGQRFGTFQLAMSVSCLTGLPIMGGILDSQQGSNYMGLQLFSGLSCLLGAGMLVGSTYLFTKFFKTWKV